MSNIQIKVSIITVCLNSEKTIEHTIKSVLSQNYENIEYIIIDGGSVDKTKNIINKYRNCIKVFIEEDDDGIYDAMNKGINCSQGEIVGIINSDDVYANDSVIKDVVSSYTRTGCDIIFGNLIYFSNDNLELISRIYSSKYFMAWKLRFGWMPPHPATFITRYIYDNYGLYSTEYKTGADYEFFVRLLLKYKLPFMHIDRVFIKMRQGGATTSGLKSIIRNSNEMVKSLKSNGFYANHFLIYLRLPFKLFETLFIYNK